MENSLNKLIKKIYLGTYKKLPVNGKRALNKVVQLGLRHKKLSFEVHLCEHCNLNCKGCDNFSPIAEEEYVSADSFNKELGQMAKIFGKKGIGEVRLLGGEPLLHPEISRLLHIARSNMPFATISVITNGLLLPKMDDCFIKTCKRDRIQLLITRYPVSFDYDKVVKSLRMRGIKTGVFNEEALKTLYKKPMDVTGSQDSQKMFDLCMNANHCISLREGKLFTCSTIPNIRHFNNRFGMNLAVTKEDYIDIFKVTDKRKIRKFLSRSVPFCKYCDIENEQFGIKWEVSKKEIKEWC